MTRLDLSPLQLLAACAYGAWLALATPTVDTVFWSLLGVTGFAQVAFVIECYLNPYHPRINPLPLLLTLLAAGASMTVQDDVARLAAGSALTLAAGGVVILALLALVADELADLRAARADRTAAKATHSAQA